MKLMCVCVEDYLKQHSHSLALFLIVKHEPSRCSVCLLSPIGYAPLLKLIFASDLADGAAVADNQLNIHA